LAKGKRRNRLLSSVPGIEARFVVAFEEVGRTLLAMLVLLVGCGLADGCGAPFMLARAGYDQVAGRPEDPTGKGGCDYRDAHFGHPEQQFASELVVNPVSDPAAAMYIASWCEDTETCQSAWGPLRYYKDQSEPQACKDLQEELAEAEAREREHRASEIDREVQEAAQKRAEAVRELLSRSPVQSESNLNRDIAFPSRLTPEQNEALRDVSNGVVLTPKESQDLASISTDQWHALSQMAAFYTWLN
jgi:hypothetical protein